MKTDFYTVVEVQRADNNTPSAALYYHFEDYGQAKAKFYTILAAASVSNLEYHAAFLIPNNGFMTDRDKEIYDRREEKTPFYILLENQITSEDPNVFGMFTTHYDDQLAVYSNYFSSLSSIVLSSIPYHSAHIIRANDGVMIEGRIYDRRVDPMSIIPEIPEYIPEPIDEGGEPSEGDEEE